MTKLELRRKSTLSKVAYKLTREVPQPVGVLVLGKDGIYKYAKLEELWHDSLFGECATVEGVNFVQDINVITESFLGCDAKLMAILNAGQSAQPQLRKRCIESMRHAGAKTTVIICISEHGDDVVDSSEADYVLLISEEG